MIKFASCVCMDLCQLPPTEQTNSGLDKQGKGFFMLYDWMEQVITRLSAPISWDQIQFLS